MKVCHLIFNSVNSHRNAIEEHKTCILSAATLMEAVEGSGDNRQTRSQIITMCILIVNKGKLQKDLSTSCKTFWHSNGTSNIIFGVRCQPPSLPVQVDDNWTFDIFLSVGLRCWEIKWKVLVLSLRKKWWENLIHILMSTKMNRLQQCISRNYSNSSLLPYSQLPFIFCLFIH